jgi:2-polyprenyl-6-methoxyphenol hydroxylase-like FAD-dependent oxidoreductase
LLIGADGLHSGVGELVFAAEAEVRSDLGILVAAFLLDQAAANPGERAVLTLAAPGRTAALARLGPDRKAALLTFRSADMAGALADGPHVVLSRTFPDLDWLPKRHHSSIGMHSPSRLKPCRHARPRSLIPHRRCPRNGGTAHPLE